jgi:hypothetical protein
MGSERAAWSMITVSILSGANCRRFACFGWSFDIAQGPRENHRTATESGIFTLNRPVVAFSVKFWSRNRSKMGGY